MFTKYELEVMGFLWSAKEPMSKKDIIELMPNRSWKPNSASFILKCLQEKGAIEVNGIKRSDQNHYSRTFITLISQEEYATQHLRATVPNLNISGIMSAMIDSEDITAETLDELKQIIEKKISELGE